jgi:hypothetical protein
MPMGQTKCRQLIPTRRSPRVDWILERTRIKTLYLLRFSWGRCTGLDGKTSPSNPGMSDSFRQLKRKLERKLQLSRIHHDSW